jgi:hypothetical protein
MCVRINEHEKSDLGRRTSDLRLQDFITNG